MTGKWLEANERPCSAIFKCSECGGIAYFNHGSNHKKKRIKECRYKYCPSCGIEMEAYEKPITRQ